MTPENFFEGKTLFIYVRRQLKNLLAVKLFTTISVLSKSGPDPLKNLSAFNIGESSTCQRNAILNGISLAGR